MTTTSTSKLKWICMTLLNVAIVTGIIFARNNNRNEVSTMNTTPHNLGGVAHFTVPFSFIEIELRYWPITKFNQLELVDIQGNSHFVDKSHVIITHYRSEESDGN